MKGEWQQKNVKYVAVIKYGEIAGNVEAKATLIMIAVKIVAAALSQNLTSRVISAVAKADIFFARSVFRKIK